MSTSHTLKPSDRKLIVSVAEDLADDVFVDEAARQKNIETIEKYMEEIKELDERLEKIEATSATKTEQQATERELRLKRNQILDIVKDLSAKKQLDEFKTKDKAAKKSEESKPTTEIKIPTTELTKMQLDEMKKPEYYRNAVIAKAYKTNIKTIYDEIENFMKVPSSQLTEQQRDERQLVVKSKIETLKTMVSEYKKCNEEMTKVCDREDVQKHLEELHEVIMISNSLTAKVQAEDELNKKRLALVKSEQL